MTVSRVWEVHTDTKIIGLCGKAKSGKDTIAAMLAENYRYVYSEAFADCLKETCAALFRIPEENFREQDLKEKKDELWDVSPREILQFVGTELIRDKMHQLLPDTGSDFWIRTLTNRINERYTADDVLIITDVRFPNEVEWIQANGGIVAVVKRDVTDHLEVGIPGHSSEADISVPNGWLILNNSTRGALFNEVTNLAKFLKLIPRSQYID